MGHQLHDFSVENLVRGGGQQLVQHAFDLAQHRQYPCFGLLQARFHRDGQHHLDLLHGFGPAIDQVLGQPLSVDADQFHLGHFAVLDLDLQRGRIALDIDHLDPVQIELGDLVYRDAGKTFQVDNLFLQRLAQRRPLLADGSQRPVDKGVHVQILQFFQIGQFGIDDGVQKVDRRVPVFGGPLSLLGLGSQRGIFQYELFLLLQQLDDLLQNRGPRLEDFGVHVFGKRMDDLCHIFLVAGRQGIPHDLQVARLEAGDHRLQGGGRVIPVPGGLVARFGRGGLSLA